LADLADVIRVIDVAKVAEERIVRVLLNADLDKAMACLSEPGVKLERAPKPGKQDHQQPIQYWLWRKEMAERIARDVDQARYGVAAMYLIGSVKNAIAGPASDIDLMVHFQGNKEQKAQLLNWLDGWSRCLAEVNFLKTGYRSEGLLDVHLVTDEDIKNRSSFAVKIGAVTDAAYELPMNSG